MPKATNRSSPTTAAPSSGSRVEAEWATTFIVLPSCGVDGPERIRRMGVPDGHVRHAAARGKGSLGGFVATFGVGFAQ